MLLLISVNIYQKFTTKSLDLLQLNRLSEYFSLNHEYYFQIIDRVEVNNNLQCLQVLIQPQDRVPANCQSQLVHIVWMSDPESIAKWLQIRNNSLELHRLGENPGK